MFTEFEPFLGKHTLSGFLMDHNGSVQICRFTLDGNHYAAIEDPVDGYRSELETIRPDKDMRPPKIKPVKVVGKHKTDGDSEVLQFVNPKTGKPILEIGTSNCSDYYPGYVAEFHPENI